MRGLLDFLRRADGHEAHEDVRLAEVADAPGEQRDELDGVHHGAVRLRQRLEHRALHLRDGCYCRLEAAALHRAADRHDEDGEEHHDALDEVRARDGEEAADERVEDDGASADEDGVLVGNAEDRLEEAAGRDEARRGVDDEEDQDEDGRHDAQQAALVVVAVLQEFRQRQRVVGELRVLAQARSDEVPVGPGADGDADGNPAGVEAGEVGIARHAHEHPAAHIRGFGGERGDPGAELAVAEEVVAHIACAAVVIHADGHHEADVEHKGIDDGKIMSQNESPISFSSEISVQE